MKKKRMKDHPDIIRLVKKGVLIMKLTLFLIILGVLQSAASVYSQTKYFSMSEKQISIKELMQRIESKSEFRFFYEAQKVNVDTKVEVDISNGTIDEILKQVFDNQDIEYKVLDNNFIVLKLKNDKGNFPVEQHAQQQQKSISGKVTDSSGDSLPGVSVVIKGTTNGTITDANGNYSLPNVPANATLQFSFVGMKTQEVVVAGKTTVNVTLAEETIAVDEVVAVGYGTRTKKEVTGSISKVSDKELKVSPAIGLSSSLAGRLSGVTINQRNGEPGNDDPEILIRGISTTGDNTPLYVIDGVASRDVGISHLDPEDIESITVLKDASAAIYGARAAAGVILVTTKRGTEGKPVFTYNFNQGFVQPTRLPYSRDAATYAQMAREEGLYRGLKEVDLPFTEDDVRKYRDGSDPLNHPNTNWFKDLYNPISLQSKHNLALTGGSKAVRYFLSLGNANQDGLYTGGSSYYKQNSVRANIDVNVNDNLKFGFDINGRKEKRDFPGLDQITLIGNTLVQRPTEVDKYPNGLFGLGNGLNPLAVINEGGYQRLDRDVFNGTLTFEYKIPQIKGLSFDGFAAFDNISDFNKNFSTPWNYSTFNSATNTYKTQMSSWRTDVSLDESFSKNTSVTLNFKLKYDKKFGDHWLGGFVAYEQNKTKGDVFSAARNRFDSRIIDQLFAGTSDKAYHSNDGTGSESVRQNYFGRVSYKYAEKYLVDFNLRYDGSMNFPKGNRFGLFPGVSVGWRMSEEPFLKQVKFINDLKLRASIGKLGNDRIGSFEYLSKFGYGNNYVLGGSDVNGVIEQGVNNPNITWETTTTTNLGFDAMVLNSKVTLAVDVFKKHTTGMLIARNLAIPDLAGFTPPNQNAGTMENKGIEMSIDYRNKFGALGFNAGGNISFSKNKVLDIDEVINPEAPWQAQTGHKLNRLLVLDAIGMYKTQADLDKYPHYPRVGIGELIYRDVNKDGIINGLDIIPVDQTATPEIVFGFNMGLTWKNFDLSMLFQGQARALQPIEFSKERYQDRWTEQNPNGAYPRAGNYASNWSGYASDFWFQDASFLRLKACELGYNVPKSMLSKIGISEFRPYVSGSNLFTISKIKSNDPEISNDNDNRLDRATWGRVHPLTRIFNIGVRISL